MQEWQTKLITTMKKLFLLAVLFATTAFIACSDDKDDNKDASIVGTWQLVRTYGYEVDQEYDSDDTDDQEFWTFNADGATGIINWRDGSNDKMPFTYSVNEKKLTLKLEEDTTPTDYTITTLTAKELAIYIKEKDNEYHTCCFVRK